MISKKIGGRGSFIGAYICCVPLLLSEAFVPPSSSSRRAITTAPPLLAAKEPLQLIPNPTPAQIANLAATRSHSESKSGTWSESITADGTFTRYIVDGKGSITLTSANGEASRGRIGPGSLVIIEGNGGGESQLLWDVDDEMVILYSGEMFDEEQKVAMGVLGLLVGAGGWAYLGMGVM